MDGWIKRKFKWIKMILRFFRRKLITPKWPANKKGQVWLHIGCGRKDYPGFINVDIQPYPYIHVITDDISNMSNFSKNSVDMVYMCHIMEHFKLPDAILVIREMHRILKPGGLLQLSVPDFDKLLTVYNLSGGDLESIRPQLMGAQDNPYNFHYTYYTKKSMTKMLEQIGFNNVQEWDPLELDFEVKDKSMRKLKVGEQKIPISLNVCAIRDD